MRFREDAAGQKKTPSRKAGGGGRSVQDLDAGADDALADIDAQGGVDGAFPAVLTVREGGEQLFTELLHGLAGAAVLDSQVVAPVRAQPLPAQLHELVLGLPEAPDLGDGLKLPILGKMDYWLDAQHGARHGGDLPDTPTLGQILQGVHGEEGEGVADKFRHPMLHKVFPVSSGTDLFPELQHSDAAAQSTAERVEDLYFQVAALGGVEPDHVEGAGETGGEHHGDDLFIAVGGDLVQGTGQERQVGQGGLGDLAGVQAAVNILRENIHPVVVLTVGTEDAQRDGIDGLALAQLRRQIGGGVGEQSDLMGV